MFELGKILGKKVIAIKGFKERKKQRHIEPTYILFDDGETYIELEEQDYYSYHDYSVSARCIRTYKDKEVWKKLIAHDTEHIDDANLDI